MEISRKSLPLLLSQLPCVARSFKPKTKPLPLHSQSFFAILQRSSTSLAHSIGDLFNSVGISTVLRGKVDVNEADEVSTTNTKSSTSPKSPTEQDCGVVTSPSHRMMTLTACVPVFLRVNSTLSTSEKPPEMGEADSPRRTQSGFVKSEVK